MIAPEGEDAPGCEETVIVAVVKLFPEFTTVTHPTDPAAAPPVTPPPQPQAPPAAAPPPPQPEVPPAAAPAAPTVLTITVPEGVMAGQQIQIKAPTGQLVNVKVPEGCGPGSQFKIQI